MTLPNFLIIGAPKAGTTSLHYILSQHPAVFMCPVKEAGFFWAYDRPVRLAGPGSQKLHNRLVRDLNEYEALFNGVQGQRAIGESSVRYISTPNTPANIRRFVPEMKLILSLRQPAERAFSSFSHNLRDGLEPCKSFAEAIRQERSGERDDWEFCRYLDKGFYFRHITRYLELFDRRQMNISLLEDLKTDGPGLMRDIFRFLAVDERFVPDMEHRHNASGIIRNPLLRILWTRSNRLRGELRPLLPPRLRHTAFEWVIQDLEKLHMPGEIRSELTEYYRQDILQLQDLLDRDLSHWLV
ncbi:MAG: sulfotransferase domain-containing protein [Chloroflexota bacterium]